MQVALAASSSGDNTLIAAPGAGKYIVIDHISLIPASAVTATFKSGSTAITGGYTLDTKQGFVIENSMHNDDGVMTMNDNEAFVLNLGGAVAVNGMIRYRIRN